MKRLARLLLTSLTIFSYLKLSSPVFADPPAGTVSTEDGFAHLDQLGIVFANLVSSVTTLVGFGVVAMLVVGAFRFMIANGDPKALAQARGTIFWAIGGLVFVIAAYIIIQLIVGFVSLPFIGKFCIPGGVPCDYSIINNE